MSASLDVAYWTGPHAREHMEGIASTQRWAFDVSGRPLAEIHEWWEETLGPVVLAELRDFEYELFLAAPGSTIMRGQPDYRVPGR